MWPPGSIHTALRSEVVLETLAGLARDGKTNKAGVPRNPLRLALLVREYEGEIYLARPPALSAVGTKLTFSNSAGVGVPGEVYEVNADGSGEKNLTSSSSDDGGSSYSPTSTNRVVFASNRVDNQFDIYLMELASNGQAAELIRITRGGGKDVGPAVSPDGKRVAFVSDRDGDEDIYVMKLAPEGPTNVPVKLTKNTRPDPNGPPFMVDNEPEWSPDGRQIAFSSDRTGAMDIYRMKPSPEGSRDRPVTSPGPRRRGRRPPPGRPTAGR